MINPNILDWLLAPDDPSVRYQTLTALLGKSPSDSDVIAAQKLLMADGLVPRILSGQNDDGSWGDPERFYVDKYTGTVWNLLVLAELAADPTDPRVQRACEFILSNSQSTDSGGFSHQRSNRTGAGLDSGIIPCLTGNMVYSLIQLGYLGDPRLQKAIDWIAAWQRADDGIASSPTNNELYKRYEPCWGKHTCHMGAAKGFKALAAIPPEQRSPAVNAKLAELGEYFLKHHLFKKSHSLDQISRPGWLKLGFPLMYNTDILELLAIFAKLNIRDSRLQEALDILAGKQQSNGKWLMENSFNGKMLVRIEQKGKESKWITLKALSVLQAFR